VSGQGRAGQKVCRFHGEGSSPDDDNIAPGGGPADYGDDGRDGGRDDPQKANKLKTNGNGGGQW